MVEGRARKPMWDGSPALTGRTDTNKRVVFATSAQLLEQGLAPGHLCEVEITDVTGHTLRGKAV